MFTYFYFITKQTEDGRAAARHGSIDGPQAVERLLDGAYLWMQGEDALLEVVHQLLAPRLNGLEDDVAAVLHGFPWLNQRKSFFRRHGNVGAYHGDVVVREVQLYGLQPLTDAFGVGRPAEDEERTVGTQPCGVVCHPGVIESQGEHLVQQTDGVGAVAGAAAHAGLGRYGLVQMGVYAGHLSEVLLQQLVGSDDEVLLLVALDADIRHLDVAVGG